MSDINDLIARLEAVTEGSRELDANVAAAVGDMNDPLFDPRHYISTPVYEPHESWGEHYVAATVVVRGEICIVAVREPKPFTASLDAALTLVPARCRIAIEQSIDGGWFDATIFKFGESDEFIGDTPRGVKTPALALCIAALKAHAAGGVSGMTHLRYPPPRPWSDGLDEHEQSFDEGFDADALAVDATQHVARSPIRRAAAIALEIAAGLALVGTLVAFVFW